MRKVPFRGGICLRVNEDWELQELPQLTGNWCPPRYLPCGNWLWTRGRTGAREERSGEEILCQPASGSFVGATSANRTKLRLGKRSCRGISKGTRDTQLRCSSPSEAESQEWHSAPAMSKAEGCHEEGCAICRGWRLSVGEEEAWSLGQGKGPLHYPTVPCSSWIVPRDTSRRNDSQRCFSVAVGRGAGQRWGLSIDTAIKWVPAFPEHPFSIRTLLQERDMDAMLGWMAANLQPWLANRVIYKIFIYMYVYRNPPLDL